MGDWAEALDLPDSDAVRWRASGYLHDALREARPDELRRKLPPDLAGLPDATLHGPAAAERLRIDGVLDGELLATLSYHTVGHGSLTRWGRAIYCADFLEPGRAFRVEWREGLRKRMPGSVDDVSREVLGARITYNVDRGLALLPQTVSFWNALVTR